MGTRNHRNERPRRLNAEQKYPLPARERRLLVQNLLANDLIFLVLGGLLFSLAIGMSTGDWAGAFGRRAVSALADKLSGFSWLAVAGPLAVIAALETGERFFRRHSEDSSRDDMLEIRQGMNGELPRLGLGTMLLLMITVGLAEELLFRVGIIDLARALFGLVWDGPVATAAAVALSAVVFAIVHGQYGRTWAQVTVLILGLLLDALYAHTGSYLTVAAAHALYDFANLLIERRRMTHEPDYFGGKVPDSLMSEIINSRSE
jgi:membrane protease YdiL (CAAX protease family)